MNLVLFGPPGAGKGTQSQLLVEKFKLKHISTGDLLRAAIKNQTALGKEAKKYVDAGDLVPDSIMIGLIKEVMAEGQDGLLLDGFPRTTAQAEALDDLFKKEDVRLDRALFLEVPRNLLQSRLTGRRVCTQCGSTFHVELRPSKKEGICDVCGGKLIHRADDREDVIGNRLEVYDKSTSPLKAYYQKAHKFVAVDGVGEPNQVLARIEKALAV